MKININGVTRDMTPEEEVEMLTNVPAVQSAELTPDERMDEIEAAMMELAELIGGAE